jgi:outer membrane murein-binding lipoprotein Lpp
MRNVIVLAACLFVLALGGGAKADELTELKKQVNLLQQKIEQLEAKQKAQEQKVDEKISKAMEQKQIGALPDSLKWAEKVKLSGDLRYRHESINKQSSGRWNPGDNKNRIRARLQMDAKVNDDWDVTFRIASGSADPTSTNQTLEDAFSSKAIWLDMAYFNWHPGSLSGLNLYGGKMKNPFYRTGGNQLIWDDDLNPEGIAVSYKKPFDGSDNLCINGGGFWVDQSSTLSTSLWGVQSYVKHLFEDKNHLLGGISYYNYGNIEERGDLKSTWSSSSSFLGNSVVSSKYKNDYDIVEAFGEYGFAYNEVPMSLFGNYVKNVAATSSGDAGWLIGVKINKAKYPGSWEFAYDYRDLQSDAVVGQFNDSDFAGGGTDAKGHRFGFKYQIAKNLEGCLTYFMDKLDTSGNDDKYNRLQADLVFKF